MQLGFEPEHAILRLADPVLLKLNRDMQAKFTSCQKTPTCGICELKTDDNVAKLAHRL